jgi:hypothetical protein
MWSYCNLGRIHLLISVFIACIWALVSSPGLLTPCSVSTLAFWSHPSTCSQHGQKHQVSEVLIPHLKSLNFIHIFSEENLQQKSQSKSPLFVWPLLPCVLTCASSTPQWHHYREIATLFSGRSLLTISLKYPQSFLEIWFLCQKKLFKLYESMCLDILSKFTQLNGCTWHPSQLLNISIIAKETLHSQLPSSLTSTSLLVLSIHPSACYPYRLFVLEISYK